MVSELGFFNHRCQQMDEVIPQEKFFLYVEPAGNKGKDRWVGKKRKEPKERKEQKI